jgi:hypothetical protein
VVAGWWILENVMGGFLEKAINSLQLLNAYVD